MKTTYCKTIVVNIWMCGSPEDIKRFCRNYCFSVGLCVTVTPTEFIYRGGEESGVLVGIRNYPRFPSVTSHLMETAVDLAGKLIKHCAQLTAMVEGPEHTIWLSRRPDNGQGENG